MNETNDKDLNGVYMGMAGLGYTVIGVLEILVGFGAAGGVRFFAEMFRLIGDPFNGVVLLVIGLVFLKAFGLAGQGNRDGISYAMGGTLMASTLMGFYVLNALSNGLGFLLGFEDWAGWTLADSIKPGLVLWLFTIPSLLVVREPRWRE